MSSVWHFTPGAHGLVEIEDLLLTTWIKTFYNMDVKVHKIKLKIQQRFITTLSHRKLGFVGYPSTVALMCAFKMISIR